MELIYKKLFISQKKIPFASDNWTPAHPSIMKAIIEANVSNAPSYGSDRWTEEAHELIQEVFKKECKVFIVAHGIGANILALKLACRRHELSAFYRPYCTTLL